MKIFKLDKTAWDQGIEKLKAAYSLFGPVKDGACHEFRPLGPGQAADLAFQNTRLSAKGLIYPQTQVMFTYNLDPEAVRRAAGPRARHREQRRQKK